MKIIEKMAKKSADHYNNEGVTIAFLGDSVTQGCFECYKKENNQIETIFDKMHSYEQYVFEILNVLYPVCTVNIINAGISGDNTNRAKVRVDSAVIRHQPDLTVVCYGLNDCGESEDSIIRYVENLREVFTKLKNAGSEIIFMTPNMMSTKVSPFLSDPDYIRLANALAKRQEAGWMDKHMDGAKALCKEMDIPVCDCYALWKNLYKSGVDVTELLANKLNHPTRDMNWMFAYELVKTMFGA